MRYQLRYVRAPEPPCGVPLRCAITIQEARTALGGSRLYGDGVVDDPRWPRAGDWLAAGPGVGTPDLAVLGVPTFATSISPTGAHATPAAVRRALGRLSTWAPGRGVDLSLLAPWDLGNVDDPDDAVEGEWRTRQSAATAVAKARLLVALGGDNSATYPVMAGMAGDELSRAGPGTPDPHPHPPQKDAPPGPR